MSIQTSGTSGRFDETVTYNANGSITSLQRNGMKNNGTFGAIDNLTISYNGNQLVKVTDAAEALNYSDALDFHDGDDTACEYDYDSNGALTRDSNRGIKSIAYDYAHYPSYINMSIGKKIRYVDNDYTADGRKLSSKHKAYPSGNISVTTTDLYIDGLMLRNDAPLLWRFDGGYVDLNANGTPTRWNYYIADHLGSTRMVVDSNDSIRETINYYPFGSEMRISNPAQMSGDTSHPFRFTGKELDRQNSLNMYDFGARLFDVAGVPMWTSVDPLAEKNPNITPYHFCHNNPINRIDPDGMDDYFSTNGAFMYCTSKGSNVYVGNDLITDVSLTSKASRQAVANVMGYYAKQVGISYYAKGGNSVGNAPIGIVGLADCGKSSDATLARTYGDDIHVNKHDNKIGSALYDKYNIISTLEHEKYHKEAGHGWQENMSPSAHASVYAQQINSDTFLKTTENYQNGIIHSFLNILESAIRDGVSDKRINSLIDDANNSLKKSGHQIVYERDGGDSFNLYFR